MAALILFNAALCIYNLLPIKYFDGGKILYSILSVIIGPFAAERFVEIVSRLLTLFILFAGIFLFYESRYNFTMLIAAMWLLYVVNGEKLV